MFTATIISTTMITSFTALAGCHDVFYEILDHIDPRINGDYNGEDQKIHILDRPSRTTLLSLALCCHVFLDSSLNKLWHSLDDLSPLLTLWPNYQHRIPINVRVQTYYTMVMTASGV